MKKNSLNRKATIKHEIDSSIIVFFEDSDGICFKSYYDDKRKAESDRIMWEKGLYNIAEKTLDYDMYNIDKAATEGYQDAKEQKTLSPLMPYWIAGNDILENAYRIGVRNYFNGI